MGVAEVVDAEVEVEAAGLDWSGAPRKRDRSICGGPSDYASWPSVDSSSPTLAEHSDWASVAGHDQARETVTPL